MVNTKQRNIAVVQKGALQILAARLHVSSEDLERTLMNTVCKPIVKKQKLANGSWKTIERSITKEEFLSFVIVANSYGLNPLTKEIYAYPDKGAIIPIVSTDGWNKLMTTHPQYKGHRYKFSDEISTMDENSRECPAWCEITISKRDGSEITVREYLDEVYRPAFKTDRGIIIGPWQTHTKRMLRHKTKIQGAREAFGFGGIYDEDEATRIIEAEEVPPVKEITVKPEVEQPKTKDEVRSEKIESIKDLAEKNKVSPADYGFNKSWDEVPDERLDEILEFLSPQEA